MKYGEKDQSWRTTGRLRSVEVDYLGRVTIEHEVHYLHQAKADEVMGRVAHAGIPGWVKSFSPMFVGSGVSAGDGHGRITLRYSGMTTPESAPGDTRGKDDREKQVSVEVSLERTPLTMHPRIDHFLKTYGGTFDGNEITWVERDPTKQSKGTGVSKDGDIVEGINPFYGLQDYLEVGVIARVSEPRPIGFGGLIINPMGGRPQGQSSDTGWSAVLKETGKVSAPPPQVPNAPKGRNWLCIECEMIRQGTGSILRQAWQLSGIGGWEPLIYDPQNAPTEARSGGEEGEGGGGGGGE
jgi:hypothetical protein